MPRSAKLAAAKRLAEQRDESSDEEFVDDEEEGSSEESEHEEEEEDLWEDDAAALAKPRGTKRNTTRIATMNAKKPRVQTKKTSTKTTTKSTRPSTKTSTKPPGKRPRRKSGAGKLPLHDFKPEELRKAFELLDTQGKGYLMPEDLARAAEMHDVAYFKGELHTMLREVDKRGDRNGRVSLEDFMLFMKMVFPERSTGE